MQRNLLIIEDETSVAKQLKWALNKQYEITVVSDTAQARQLLATRLFPVATLDLGLPPFPDTPQEGFRLLEEIPSLAPYTKVIVITGSTEEENAIRAVSLGAADFCAKPLDLKILEIILSRTFRIHELEESYRRLSQQTPNAKALCGMLGVSPPMISLFELIRQVSATDYAVLITGESGTGKEMAAKAVHTLSERVKQPFVIVNSGAIPENLLESELFGHERGAFTGAVSRKVGKFELADKGTLFLDEIGDLPLPLQVKILRFLQEGTIERIGGNRTISTDVRVIAATNQNLEEEVKRGAFREDLFYRLNVVPLRIPSLRERPEDIIMLAQHFLREETTRMGRSGQISLSPSAMAAMTAHDWPGNVRELQNRIRRALTIVERIISPADLGLASPDVCLSDARVSTLQAAREEAELKAIQNALALTGNNVSKAAQILNVSRPTLHDLLKKHGMNETREKRTG
ncbi:MAG: PEP-CTERM-box response regulator transcription factor [Smithellaceae bacterium]